MKFRVYMDVTIEAENLDDAFNKIASHFHHLMNNEESHLIESGEAYVHLMENSDPWRNNA